MLDEYQLIDVIWDPWCDHRVHRAFEPRSLYRGYFRLCFTVVPYCADRCMWQFGYVQTIPGTIRPLGGRADDLWHRTALSSTETLLTMCRRAQFSGQVSERYFNWYYDHSHPMITSPLPPPPPRYDDDPPADDDPPVVVGSKVFTARQMRQITHGIRDAMSLLNPEGGAYQILSNVFQKLSMGRDV